MPNPFEEEEGQYGEILVTQDALTRAIINALLYGEVDEANPHLREVAEQALAIRDAGGIVEIPSDIP
jgi:hypothetical protein